ncbi:hypothetical protein GCHA_1731 [Paraglaciecola chathamensis S18K6]|uniref:Uncharacterized protein n=2 Tax=Paraglaciecola chathamensis TaxID=368405 RepID=A0ABQ0I4I4_9ALTE|nr:hypothetical protein GAGA_1330 [Paraglaciecola agarilytica NO2]GAC09682.1 hypothetical protein GCHA_1731 [Paraglaciecola chathamensis S18K6]
MHESFNLVNIHFSYLTILNSLSAAMWLNLVQIITFKN